MLTTITLTIDDDHISEWYALAAEYHKNRSTFFKKRKGNVESEENTIKSGEPIKQEKTLFEHIVDNCTCGDCYLALARPDRVPWRSESGKYINVKHGVYTPPAHCLAPMHPFGYIYEKKAGRQEGVKTDLRKEPAERWKNLEPKVVPEPERVHPEKIVPVTDQPPTPEKKSQPTQKTDSDLVSIAHAYKLKRTTLLSIAEFIHTGICFFGNDGKLTRKRATENYLSMAHCKETAFRKKFGTMGLKEYAQVFFSSYANFPLDELKCNYTIYANAIVCEGVPKLN
jgi:hypothetical protein